MKITTTLCPNNEYYAIDLDSYDGAPDSHSPQGWGKTPLEAVQDLIAQLEEVEEGRRSYAAAQGVLNAATSVK